MNLKFSINLPSALCTASISILSAQIHHPLVMAQAVNQPNAVSPKTVTQSSASTTGSSLSIRSTNATTSSPRHEANFIKINTHFLNGDRAATLYIREIPVLTFIDSASTTSNSSSASDDPVERAQQVAAQLKSLSRNHADANSIAVTWNSTGDRVSITINNRPLVEINQHTRLPDTTGRLTLDALQATNRIRRLIGSAPPLSAIAGTAKHLSPVATTRGQQSVAQPGVSSSITGVASWYGPGFNGRRSASGEIYNQNALTAAHRSLPFGTQVRVTNLRNNRSVVVRINDRGPFIRGRAIDLSAAAARVIGMANAGTAPVLLEVLDPTQITASVESQQSAQ